MNSLLILIMVITMTMMVWGYTFESFFPDENRTKITCNFDRTLGLDVSEMRVHIWDYKHDFYGNYSIESGGMDIDAYKHIDYTRKFIVFIPGFLSDVNGDTAMWIRDAFQSINEELFLVMFDYSTYTRVLTPANVQKIIPYSYYIGDAAAKVLADLNTAGLPSQNIHVIGHSMGNHVCGYVGGSYKDKTGELIGRITAISPAGSCWPDARIEDQVSADKANYVETIHCTEVFGTAKTISDVDFFYNAELEAQPGCYDDKSDISTKFCNHIDCVRLWAETVTHPDWYGACSSYGEYVEGKCKKEVIAGYHNNGEAFGVFYASTLNPVMPERKPEKEADSFINKEEL